VICLDTKNQPTAINVCHVGSVNASIVHSRECFKPAILSNSASMHNHPSGVCDPSREDIEVTKRQVDAGNIIEVIDHIIVGENCFVSLKERGRM
jgi:DNA repair protein RadC